MGKIQQIQKSLDDASIKAILESVANVDIHSRTAKDIYKAYKMGWNFKYAAYRTNLLEYTQGYWNHKTRIAQGDEAYNPDGSEILQPTTQVPGEYPIHLMDLENNWVNDNQIRATELKKIEMHMDAYRHKNRNKKGYGQSKKRWCSCRILEGLFEYLIIEENTKENKANISYFSRNLNDYGATFMAPNSHITDDESTDPHVTDEALTALLSYFGKDVKHPAIEINWTQVLDDYVPEYKKGYENRPNEQRQLKCPLHWDTRQSLELNLRTLSWWCGAGCGAGSFHTLAARVSGKPWSKLKDQYRIGDTSESLEIDSPKVIEEPLQATKNLGNVPSQFTPKTTALTNDHWAIKDRHFKLADLIEWGCKEAYDGLYIPVFESGEEVGYTIRSNQGLDYKYRNARGFSKSKHLYGVDRIPSKPEYLIVVEGQLDVIRLASFGYMAVGLFGSDMSDTQLDLLLEMKPSNLVFAFDNDAAGKEGLNKILNKRAYSKLVSFELGGYIHKIEFGDQHNDFGDITDKTIVDNYFNRKITL